MEEVPCELAREGWWESRKRRWGWGCSSSWGGTAFEEPRGEVVMEPFGGRGEGLGEAGQSGWQPQERERQQGVCGGVLEFL